MLLKSRSPGPRAKHLNLPSIPYGTVWTRMGFGLPFGLAYRFHRHDVEKIARLVHGDVEAHVAKKIQERSLRHRKKRKALWIALKLRYHKDNLQVLRQGTPMWVYHIIDARWRAMMSLSTNAYTTPTLVTTTTFMTEFARWSRVRNARMNDSCVISLGSDRVRFRCGNPEEKRHVARSRGALGGSDCVVMLRRTHI
nr:hypothetical protein CFP56_76753 [Quercus suber]